MPITLKQIAAKSRVSLMTVSYVLNDKGHLFRPETRDRVLKAAAQLGYRRNASARATRQGRFNRVALVISDTDYKSAISPELLTGFHAELLRHDMHLTISQLPDDKLTDDEFLPKFLRESMADGLLIHYVQEIPERMIDLIQRHRLPSIWTNVKRAHDCVHPDDLAAARLATGHLLELGHRRIAYVDGSHVFEKNHERQDHYSAADRFQGYCDAMKAAGFKPRLLSEHGSVPASQINRFVAEALSRRDRPTALVCYSARETVGAAMAAAWRQLRIPEDLSIVTFNHQPVDVGRPITTALIPERKMGVEAMRALLQKIAAPDETLPRKALPFTLSAAVSSAAPLSREINSSSRSL